jgi:probable F420-dependent oxidoreductase
MRFGVYVTQFGPAANRDAVLELAQMAEALGYDAICASDHLVFPAAIRSHYPYTEDGRYPVPPETPYLESLTLLAFLAACTSRVRLVTSVLVLPQRNPVEVAKMYSCIDVLSGGRLIAGVGVGWLAEEFALLGIPFEERGRRFEECVRVLKALWTEREPRFEGRYYSLPEARMEPKPLQRPHPPIWLGGHTPVALRRAARWADGWLAVDVGGTSLDRVREHYALLQSYAREYGRDAAAVTLNVLTGVFFDVSDREGAIAQMQAYQEAGADFVLVRFRPGPTAEATLESYRQGMRWFAEEVRPAVAG